jgi:hypothetical protein
MRNTIRSAAGRSLTIVAAAALFTACSDDRGLAPDRPIAPSAGPETSSVTEHDRQVQHAVRTLRRVTARYHNLELAKKDGFVLLHECEEIPGEGPIGTVYVNFDRLLDGGGIDPESPEALIYEPQKNGPPELVGAEFAIAFTDWTLPTPPKFLGNAFQAENDVGAFGLHVWIWRNNPNGLFAETNPSVSCGEP